MAAVRDPVTGDKELVQALRILGRGLRATDLDRAMTVAARPMLNEAKERAKKHRQPGKRPKGGHLDEGLVFIRDRSKNSSKTREFVIGGINRARYLIPWLERGTARHWQPRRFGGIWHPGARPFPFMRPAFDGNDEKVLPLFSNEIWKRVQQIAMTLPKGRR